ncbi:MAG: EAL domain-containing protein [Actinomycetia bacterium]|nr:EAL domain-containing protein [Actinomycetes bacterium]MCP5030170.1 EAL domain-containing protein [Actinomycetes bacterium]
MADAAPEVSQATGRQERLDVLRDLADTADSVRCFDAKLQFRNLPPEAVEFGLEGGAPWGDGVDRSTQSRPLSSIEADDRPLVLGLLGMARAKGLAFAKIRFTDLDGDVAALHVINMVREWGVYIAVRGGHSDRVDPLGAADSITVTPRRLVYHRDATATFLWVDEATEQVLGWTADELLGRQALDFIHADDAERAIESWLAMVAGAPAGVPVRLRYRTSSGAYRWFEVHNTSLLNDPEYGYVESELIDIDDEMLALARVRDSELQYSALAESLPVGVIQVDAGGEVVFANDWLKGLTGLTEPSAIAAREWVAPDDRGVLASSIDVTLMTGSDQKITLQVIDKFGNLRTCRTQLRPLPLDNGRGGVIASIEDMTSTLDMHEQLRLQACRDELTGLPNRRALRDWLDEKQGDKGLVVFFVDLDGFKLVNDGLGHEAGDELLVSVARAIRGSVRPNDIVARLGGDEFVVGCVGLTDLDGIRHVAERILDMVSSPIVIGGNVTTPACSIGVAMADTASPDGSPDLDQLLGDADIAMYEAKQAGGRCHVFFEEELRHGVQRQVQIASSLRVALSQGQMELYLQPIVELGTGRRVGAEALVRWNHPEMGLVPPPLFIPVAERTRMIETLGAWIIDDACRLGAKMATRSPTDRIAINVSPRQLAATGFLDLVLAAMSHHGVDPHNVVLEVTETVFLDMGPGVLNTLDALVSEGVSIALDDFGTGYSSLNHLRQMPTQIVKIDRTYTADVGVDARTTAIIEAMVGLAGNLGQELVAEGIETEQQAATMRDLGISLAQGYLLGYPVPEADFFAQAKIG